MGVGVGGGAVRTGTTVRPSLSLGRGSRTAPVTDQPTGASPGVTPVRVTSTGTVLPGRTTPRSHWRVVGTQEPSGLVIRVTVTPAGGAMVSRVPGEAAGPLFTTSTRTVVESPTVTSGTVPGARTARSTDCWTLGSLCRPGRSLVSLVSSPVTTFSTLSFSGLLTGRLGRS